MSKKQHKPQPLDYWQTPQPDDDKRTLAVSDRSNQTVLNALYDKVRLDERQRQFIYYTRRDKIKDALHVLDKMQLAIAVIIKLATGADLVNELMNADNKLLEAFNDMRKAAKVLGYDVETQAPDCVEFTYQLVTLVGDITNPNALNPVTPNEGARQIEALYHRYNPDFPKLLTDIGRPSDIGRQYLVEQVRELKHAFKQSDKGLMELGRAIYDRLRRADLLDEREQAALTILKAYCEPHLRRKDLEQYMKGLTRVKK